MPVSGCSASQCYDVPEAPTFRPTEVEFADPLAYIAAIRPEAEQYGACKIIPPWSWRPPFALDRKAFRFKTRVQSVHELQERSSAEDAFEEDYLAWLKEMNRTWKGHPLVNSREVDLFRLFKAVGRRGGYDKVSEQRAWKDVCKALQVRPHAYASLPVRVSRRVLFRVASRARRQLLGCMAALRPSTGSAACQTPRRLRLELQQLSASCTSFSRSR